jgi:exopolysaccharide biosynthesis polyprenyl glycosylphosphotransferase
MYQNSNNLLTETTDEYQRHSQSNIKSSKNNNTLIIGLNRDAIELYERVKSYPALGYKVIGFISIKEFKKDPSVKIPYLGNFNTILKNIQQHNIKTVLIAIAPDQHSYLDQIISICAKYNVTYQIVSDVYDTVYGNVIKDIYHEIYQYRELGLRRVMDFSGSIFLLIALFPLFLLVALAIKIESPGSIFYSQQRSGKNGNPFRIYKFRSMVQDAEQKSGPVWAQKNDSRITSVGNFLRKSRIDELPQLLNIFKGDMSFIGPRPERPFFVESFKQQIPFYFNRLIYKPGVTGWAQVKWGYDETIDDVKEKLKFDLYYINNRTIWLDVKIVLLTFSTVLLGKGQ